MSKFIVENGQFWLDGQPQLIQAGEFHYFRTPREEWRHRLGLLKAAGFNAVASYIPWLWHQLDEDVSDFDGNSHPMRNLAGFLDLAAEMGLLIIARPGPYINAETINEGIPPWVFRKYPQVTYINQDHQPQNIVSYLHPDFLAVVRKWYRAVFQVLAPRQVTQQGKIVLIQLDNEMGMMHWVRNMMDINPDTLARFASYLEKTYNRDLTRRYPAGQLQDFLRKEISQPTETWSEKSLRDYKFFYREYLEEYCSILWSEAKANGMEVPPVINIHGFANGGKTFPIGLSQLINVMRMEGIISATDVYPGIIGEGTYHQLVLVNEITKALQNPQQPLFSIEFQAGGNQDHSNGQSSFNDLHSRLCISTGMRAINHYLFCDGENNPVLSPVKRHDWGHPVRKDGTLRRHYHRYPQLSNVLHSYGADLVLARPRTVTSIGFILDYFMTEVSNSFTREATRIITHQRDVVLFDMIARGLALSHRPFNVIDLERQPLDVKQTPLLWVMMEKQCSAPIQQKLAEYILQGGKLILAGRICETDLSGSPCTILKDAIGIQGVKTDPPFTGSLVDAFDYVDIPVSFLETYTGSYDEVFAISKEGETAGFIQSCGKGQVMVFGAAMTADTLDDLDVVHQMALKMECQPLFHLEPWADARISCGANGDFLFLANYQEDPVDTVVNYENHPLFGGNAIHLPARRGAILPLDWQAHEGIRIHFITSEVVGVTDTGSQVEIWTQQQEFLAELTLTGYLCNEAASVEKSGNIERVRVEGRNGKILLTKAAENHSQ